MSPLLWFAPQRPGVVTGLQAEARLAALLGRVEAGGGLPTGAAAAAERLVAQGVPGLVSFGLCGGLDPALSAGSLVVPRTVVVGGQSYPTCPELSAALGGWTAEVLLAGEEAVSNPLDKRELFAATGAAAIDLESGAVAKVAARAGLPFAVLRAVCDPAQTALPPAALVALDSRGAISVRAVMLSLLRDPLQIPSLIAVGQAAAAARSSLIRRVDEILVRRGGSGRLMP